MTTPPAPGTPAHDLALILAAARVRIAREKQQAQKRPAYASP